MSRSAFRLLLLLILLGACSASQRAQAEPFAAVTSSRDVVDGISATAAPVTGSFAKVSDARETQPLPPPPSAAVAPVEDRLSADTPIAPEPAPSASPTFPPLVKRPIPQHITQAAPGVLVVQPGDIPSRAMDAPLKNGTTINGQMFNDRTQTLTPEGVVDNQPEPEDGFSFGGGAGASDAPLPVTPSPNVSSSALEQAPSPTAPLTTSPTQPVSPSVKVTGPVRVLSTSTPVSVSTPPQPLTQPIAAGLTFVADETSLNPKLRQQLQTFVRLAKGNVLKQVTLTQRTVAPLNALNTLADARRKLILDTLRAEGIVTDATAVSEVRARSTGAASKVTLIGN